MLKEIDISVVSKYLGQQKQAADKLVYVFSYTVNICNNSPYPVQLLRRYWLVTNGDGEKVEVEGDGVIGEQPVIMPQQCFDYTSASILKTPVGTMQGHYEFELHDGNLDKAAIPVFSLAIPNSVH